MLTENSLKVEIVKHNNRFHENSFRDILNHLRPKISKWSNMISKYYIK